MIYLSLLMLLFCTLSCMQDSVSKKIYCISDKEREQISDFFRYLIYDSSAPFTLFGDKPISILSFNVETNPFYLTASSQCYAMKKNCEVWKKYAQMFPSKNFVMTENITDKPSQFNFLIINRKACLETINNNFDLFKEILENMNSEEILSSLESSKNIFETLKHHQGLLGMLLGFGKNNSYAFHHIYECGSPLKPLKLFREETDDFLHLFTALNFAMVEDDGETILLKQKYENQKKIILDAYKNRDLLEVTLEKFVQ